MCYLIALVPVIPADILALVRDIAVAAVIVLVIVYLMGGFRR